jgi:hypothetical protein
MKSILVPVGGGGVDESMLEIALAVAPLFSAHLQFTFIRVGPGKGVLLARVAFAAALHSGMRSTN